MKKALNLLVVLGLCFGLTGCGGSSKTPEETLEAIKTYTDKIFIDTGNSNDDYRDLDGYCYNHQGIKKTCDRIKGDINDFYSLKIMNDEKYIDVHVDENGSTPLLMYFDEDEMSSYFNSYEKKNEGVYLSGDKSCQFYFNGKDDDVDEDDLCDSSRKEEAEKVKKDFENMLSDIGITEQDLKDFVSWYAKDEGKKLIEELKEEKNNQKPLTNEDIKEMLSEDFQFTKLDDDSVYMEDSLSHNTVMFLKKNDEHQDAMAYQYDLYDDIKLYIYSDGRYIAINDDKTCDYSLNDETSIKHSDCTTDTVRDMRIVQSNFKDILNENGITLDELFNFFINYK